MMRFHLWKKLRHSSEEAINHFKLLQKTIVWRVWPLERLKPPPRVERVQAVRE
jgi:hypothetical protein